MLLKYAITLLPLAVTITRGSDCEVCDLKDELAKTKSDLSECESKLSTNSYLNQVCSRVGSILGSGHDPALKTTVHKLLQHLNLDSVPLSPDGSSREKDLTLKITNNDLISLRRYILNDEGTDSAVQDILIRSLIPREASSSLLSLDLPQYFSNFLPSSGPAFSPHVRPGLVVAVIIGVVAVLGLILYRGVAVWKVLLFVVFMSVTMTWANMYMNAAAKKQATLARLGNVPMTCLLEKQGWASAGAEFVKSLFNKKMDPCEEYYAAAMVDPLWEVSILDAITETVCQLVIRPCAAVGIILGNFYNNVIEPIPFAWKIPVALIATLLLLFLMLLCSGYEISIPFILKIAPPPKKEVLHLNSSDSNSGRSLSGSRFSAIVNESGDETDGGFMGSSSKEQSNKPAGSPTGLLGFDGLRQRSLPYPSENSMPTPGSPYLDHSVGSGDGSCSPTNSPGGGFRYPLNMY